MDQLPKAIVGLVLLMLVLACPCLAKAQSTLPIQWLYSPLQSVSTVAYSPDGAMLAVGGNGGIQIFNVSTGTLLRGLATGASFVNSGNWQLNVNSVAFSKDGKVIAVGATAVDYNDTPTISTGVLELWNVATSQLITELTTGATSVNSVAFSADGSTLADGGSIRSNNNNASQGVLELWNVSTHGLIGTLNTAASASVNALSFSPSGSTLAVGGGASSTGVLELWNTVTKTRLGTLSTAANATVNSVAFSPSGTALADGGQSLTSGGGISTGVLELWNLSNSTLIAALPTRCASGVASVTFSNSGSTLADGGGDGVGLVEAWNVAANSLITTLSSSSIQVNAVAFSKGGSTIADGGGVFSTGGDQNFNGNLEVWSIPTSSLLASVNLAAVNGANGGNAVAYSPDGTKLANGGGGFATPGWLEIWNASSGTLITTLSTAATQINDISFSPNGQTLVAGGWIDNSGFFPVVELWNVSTGQLIARLNTAASFVNTVKFSPDGSTIAVGGRTSSDAGVIELWNVANGTLTMSLSTSAASVPGVASVAFSPDGKTLAAGGSTQSGSVYGGLLELWNTSTGTRINSLNTTANQGIASVAFTPDGKTLVSGGLGSGGGVIELWTVSTGQLLANVPVATANTSITSLAISSDGGTLFVGAGANLEELQVYSMKSYALLAYYDVGFTASAFPIAIAPSGNQIALGCGALEVVANQFESVIPVSTLTISPDSVIGGTSATGTVTVSQPAASSGDTVILTSSNTSIVVPANIVVPSGATQASFTITTRPLTNSATATITATSGGVSASASIAVSNLSVTTLTLQPTTVKGGDSSIGVVTLSGPAPTGGVSVSLSASSANATVPATVFVAGGATTGKFTVTAALVSAISTVSITAGTDAGAKSATLTIDPMTLLSLSLSPTTVVGGSTSIGKVTLSGLAGVGGTTLFLTSSSAAASVSAATTVPAGQASATFTVNTNGVAVATAAKVTASLNGTSFTATLTVKPASLAFLTVSPTTVLGGTSSAGAVGLSGLPGPSGTVVSLTSNNRAALVPKSVTIAAGQTGASFTVTTIAVSAQTVAVITAKSGSIAKTAKLTITGPTLVSISVNPSTVVGGTSATGTVTISSVAGAGGLVVRLSSSIASAVVPGSVTVLAGKTTATVVVKTAAVPTLKVATLTAKLGTTSRTTTLTITPPTLLSLTLNPTTVIGGKSSTGTVTISSIAPSGGLRILLSSSQSSAVVPAYVTIPAGRTSATFAVPTKKVTTSTAPTITATLAAVTKTAVLTIT